MDTMEINLNEEIKSSCIEPDHIIETNEDSTLHLLDAPFSLPLKISSFSSDKDLFVFVKNVEKLVRSSLEYKYWTSYITDTLCQNTCALTEESLVECNLDVHHHPITLFIIVKTIVEDFITKDLSFTSYDIALKTIELHYQNKIGYMVLLSNMHAKYHAGFQKLPVEFIHGDYKYMINNYDITEDELLHISELCSITQKDLKLEWSANNYPGVK